MELIEGKWYKNLGEKKDHIGKFDGWYNLNIISVSEYIYKGELHGYSKCFTEAYKFAKECPLSEIQQYLPDGHPDKEFVLPEKWCVKCISQEEANAVETHLFGSPVNNIYLPKYVTNKGVSGPGHNSSYYKRWDCKEITFEQFKKYVLKTKEMEEREIIGYKLKEDCEKYIPALDEVCKCFSFGNHMFDIGSVYYEAFEEAGVLNLWFEPIFKEKFKIGDWVTWSNDVTGRIVNHCKSFADSWSLDVKGDLKEYNSCSEKWLRLATSEEIKKTLVEEAIKRGFTKGIKFKFKEQCYGKSIIEAEVRSLEAEHYKNNGTGWRVISTSSGVVYSDKYGWAEILPNYPQIEINGYKGEFFDDYVKFGCAKISREVFIDSNKLFKHNSESVFDYTECNRSIESITIGKGTFSKEQIKLIADHYLNKK